MAKPTVAEVLQRDTLAPYKIIICLDYKNFEQQYIKENGFTL